MGGVSQEKISEVCLDNGTDEGMKREPTVYSGLVEDSADLNRDNQFAATELRSRSLVGDGEDCNLGILTLVVCSDWVAELALVRHM